MLSLDFPFFARALRYILVCGGLIAVISFAKKELDQEQHFHRAIDKIDIKTPDSAPAMNDDSIKAAMEMFQIRLPHDVEMPYFDRTVEDRGITARSMFSKKYRVIIGPAAFESWPILGSTLAHEIEVHCQQDFLLISILDAVGLDGTGSAERFAYQHEIAEAKRFGLSQADQILIHNTMTTFYPESGRRMKVASVQGQLKKWVIGRLEPEQVSGRNRAAAQLLF